jgi:tRNA-binding protein
MRGMTAWRGHVRRIIAYRPPSESQSGLECRMQEDRVGNSDQAKPAGSATIEDFDRLDIRVGRVTAAEPFPEARKPAYQLTIDFGQLGSRQSSAQLPGTYPDPGALVGRLVIAVINFPPRRVAGFRSEVLVLGALPADGRIPLLSVDAGALPGDPIG